MRTYSVYILTNPSGTLYTGVTNDLKRRVWENTQKLVPGFAKKYNVSRSVYFKESSDVRAALSREKAIKAWRREKKVALIESLNRDWRDLSADWFEEKEPLLDPERDSSLGSVDPHSE